MKGLFVTGTDTGVGKTRISTALMTLMQARGLSTAGMKPVASGCVWQEGSLVNEDAVALMAQSDVDLPYACVNPYAFEPAIAPHIAASQADEQIELRTILQRFEYIASRADCVVVEGAGGFLVPLNQRETLADLALALDLPVVLVVGIRLGCINHALLSAEAIAQRGLTLAGWVANLVEHDAVSRANVDSLMQRIHAPCLGVVPYLEAADRVAQYLNWEG